MGACMHVCMFVYACMDRCMDVHMYAYMWYQELIMWRGEYLMLYSPVIYDCAEVKWLPFRVT